MPVILSNIPKIVPGTYGRIEITHSIEKDCYFLHHDGIRWMCATTDLRDVLHNMHSQYDIAYGKVLVTGLGFGILLKALEEKDTVTSITVIEKEQDVVDAFLSHNRIGDKVKIVVADAITYSTEEEYDCLIPDHYELQSVPWKIVDMNNIYKRIKNKSFWPWSIEDVFMRVSYLPNENGSRLNEILENNLDNVYGKWKSFINEYFEGNKSLLEIKEEKLLEYLREFYKFY
jgi:hypothetical protein